MPLIDTTKLVLNDGHYLRTIKIILTMINIIINIILIMIIIRILIFMIFIITLNSTPFVTY